MTQDYERKGGIMSKVNSKEYEDNYDRIFKKDKDKKCCGKCSPCSNHDKESSVFEDVKETK